MQRYSVHDSIPSVYAYRPATLKERGVAIPFESLQLAGVRARTVGNLGAEFIMPNPSGARGVYIVRWEGVRQLCQPTPRDMQLHSLIDRVDHITPSAIRLACRELALEGAAGPHRAAAQAEAEADLADARACQYGLLLRLVDQPLANGRAPRTAETHSLDHRASEILRNLANALDRTPASVRHEFSSLAQLYGPVGLEADNGTARLPRLLHRMQQMDEELAGLPAGVGGSQDGVLPALRSFLALIRVHGEAALDSARAPLGDPLSLLRHWIADRSAVTAAATHPEWVLDGWQTVVALWEAARTKIAQDEALAAILPRLPVFPLEMTLRTASGAEPQNGTSRSSDAPRRYRHAREMFVRPSR